MPGNQEIVLKIRVLDTRGEFLGGTVDTEVRHCSLGERVTERGVDASHEIDICGLRRDPTGGYHVTVSPTNGLQPQSQFVNIPACGYATLDFVLWESGVVTTPPPGPTADHSYTLDGIVTSPDRAGVGGLRVQIVDKNVGQDVMLAEAITDERGRYNVSFAAPSLCERRKEQPDLQARVYAGQTFLAASEPRYDATSNETLHVQLPPNSALLPSEHQTITSAISKRYGGQLRDLKESEDQHDITYLANKTGWDARAVALAALADQFSANRADGGAVGIQPALYYALFRAGLPANPETLYQADVQTINRIWKQSIEQGVIPKALESELPAAAQTFQRLSAARALGVRAVPGSSTLKEMLQLTLGEDARRQQQFADLYTANRSDMPKFWNSVQQAFGADTTKRLQLDGQLAYLTLNNAPLIGRLHAESHDPLSSTLDLVQRGYYRAGNWSQLLNGATIPDQIPGSTLDEKRTNYAELMAAQVRLSFPTAVVAEMVRSGEVPLNVGTDVRDGVHTFLTENQGKFEIGVHTVEQYITRNNLGNQVPDPVTAQIKRLQRVYQITPTDQAMTVLFKNSLDSAYQIVRYNEAQFVETFQREIGGEETARLIYAKAHQVHNAVLNIATSYLTARRSLSLGSDPDALLLDPNPGGASIPRAAHMALHAEAPADVVASDIIASKTLENLFGSMDFCACGECRSILSPAAYLVDLLLFIDYEPTPPEKNAGKVNPQAVLLGRRPDIQYLPLTCENTNTPVLYIDLVNETMEYFVTHTLSLTDYQGHNTDDSVSPEELLANPQFVSDAAYDTLRLAIFPAPLPFHRPLEMLRKYFDKFEVPLQRAMEVLRTDDAIERVNDTSYGWRDILMEQLKLSRAEYHLLTDSTLKLQEIYGYDPKIFDTDDKVRVDLSRVQPFTRRVGITGT